MRLLAPAGPYTVGVTTLSHPVHREVFSKARLPNGEHALVMEEVLYNVYYPADVSRKGKFAYHGIPWLLRPLAETLAGFAKFSGVRGWMIWPSIHFYGRFITIPCAADAPLLSPSDALAPSSPASTLSPSRVKDRWPLAIFSHGLAGSRTMYSQFCGRLASEGYVVLAVEHRDGSAPSVRVRTTNTEGKNKGKETWRTLLYTPVPEVNWGEKTPDRNMPFRADQLVFRSREIYEAFGAFTNIIRSGEAGPTRCESDQKHNFSQWKGTVDADGVELTGHSFGGASALAVLTTPPPPSFPSLPIKHVLLLDPWVDPVSTPGPIPHTAPSSADPDAPRTRPPLAVINSEGFTLWKEHFTRLRDISQGWRSRAEDGSEENGATLMTIVQARHDDFSDFPAIIPFKAKRVVVLGGVIQKLCLAFLGDGLAEELAKEPRRDKEVTEGKKGKKRLVGEFGEVLVHV